MASTSTPEIGEVAATRRPKLDLMLKEKRPGLKQKEIVACRQEGLTKYLGKVWERRNQVRIRVPRDVDTEELQLKVDEHVWDSILDVNVHGNFPWGKEKPPPSVPHKGYAQWFWERAPFFRYPSLEGRQQLWAELLNKAPYDPQCGPFEVMLPGFARGLVDKNAVHTLLADLPAGIMMAAKPVNEENQAGIWTLAVSLPTSSDMAERRWSKLRVSRMKNELVRCFLVLRRWSRLLHVSRQTPLEDCFVDAFEMDTDELRRLFVAGYEPPASSDNA
ncbi:hypothetical protein DHEL01_v207455 [Diaporthe helianthi]|uniref:Uncharacterized protein n=1 Tax=Diaporthe helianthi TaxID=158607 RepID=A0A2P5HV82_DIAHE|nr:hypothetical protein DHEL01_v207455 [Diaporthe helianthi]